MEKKSNIQIVCPPHERPEGESVKPVPTTSEEFYKIVNEAAWPELKQYGFRKWETMNNVIKENVQRKDEPTMISIPVISAPSPEAAADAIVGIIEGDIVKTEGSMILDLGCDRPLPMDLLEEDEDIILFPGEWYNIIPDGFKCTGLSGDEYTFQKGKSDDDIRFGCLPYGIRRKTAA